MAFAEIKKKDPPCERCFPGVLPENIEAWQVYQVAALDPMGISLEGIKIACECFGARDVAEVVLKIGALLEGMSGTGDQHGRDHPDDRGR